MHRIRRNRYQVFFMKHTVRVSPPPHGEAPQGAIKPRVKKYSVQHTDRVSERPDPPFFVSWLLMARGRSLSRAFELERPTRRDFLGKLRPAQPSPRAVQVLCASSVPRRIFLWTTPPKEIPRKKQACTLVGRTL